jgi:hypothetical protein
MSIIEVNRRRVRDWSDALIASDPGLSRLTLALEVATGVGVTIAVEYGFAKFAHPLWVNAPPGADASAAATAALAAQHHGVTLLSMLLGGIIGMVSSLAVSDVTRRAQAITMVGMPVPFLATLAISTELAPHRTVGLVGLALVTGLGTYLRRFAPRFGPRVVMYGMLLFMGYFFGFLAGAELPIGQIYWVAAILSLAVLVNLALRIVLFDRVAAGALPRSRRSFAARARGVISEAAGVIEDAGADPRSSPARRTRRLARRLIRLNESAVVIDAQLADPRLQLRPGEAQALHDALFELELSLESLGRAIIALTAPDAVLDPTSNGRVRGWLAGLTVGDTADAETYERDGARDETFGTALASDNIVFATAAIVVEVGRSLGRWQRGQLSPVQTREEVDFTAAYESPVMLIGGNLAGSSQASNAALAPETSNGLGARLHLDGAAIAAIRVTIAVGVTSAIASAVNERRFYWAVIAVFITFVGANTAGEQIIKAAQRVLGTCVGIVLGSLLAQAVGPGTWSIAVIIPALAIGVYFIRVSYALMAIGITVMVSMLYIDLGEFSDGLLLDRLELTAIGAAIAMIAALLIFPVRTGRVIRQAALQYFDALLALIDGLAEAAQGAPRVKQPAVTANPTTAARHLDDTLQQLLVTARPITRDPFRRDELEHNLQAFVQSAQFARNLAAGAGVLAELDGPERALLTGALKHEGDLIQGLHDTILNPDASRAATSGSASDPIVESARRLAEQGVVRNDPRRRFLRALANLDGTLVQLSRQLADV